MRLPLGSIVIGLLSVIVSGAYAEDMAAIVQVSAPMRIDARIDDWSTISARHGIRHLNGEPAAALRLASDDKHLYALFEVIDDSPLKNGASVLQELLKGGDAVGLALASRKGKPFAQRILIAHVDGKPVLMALRPQWDEKNPHTFSSPVKQVKMDYVGPVAGAECALRAVPGGYVVEVALPWDQLKVNVNDLIFDAQVIFGDPSGTTNVASAWWHTSGGDAMTVEDLPSEAGLYPDSWGRAKIYSRDPGPRAGVVADVAPKVPGVPIIFTLPRAAKVSVVVTDNGGFIVRELLRAESRTAGAHTIEWDGRDRYGEVLPPGAYRWKLIYFDAMGSRFLGSVGNSAQPPYRTEDGKGSMGGQHGGASWVAAGAHGLYLMGGIEEGHPSMRAIAPDGRTLWKCSMGGFGRGVVAAADGDKVYVVRTGRGAGVTLWCLDAQSGKKIAVGAQKNDVKIGDANVADDIRGMTIINGIAYISMQSRNKLVTVNLRSGELGNDVAIPAPIGIAAAEDGTLLICSGSEVKRYHLTASRSETVVTGLIEPGALAVDKDGVIYVSELGQRQQVSRFDAKGKKLGVIGVAGGRPINQQPYDPNSLRNVVSLAIGPQQQLWMAERSELLRTAAFTCTGEWRADQFGPTAYNVVGPDLDDFRTVYYQTQQRHPFYARAAIDYAAYANNPQNPMAAWQITATRNMVQGGGVDLFGPSMAPGYGHVVSFKATNGKNYLWRFAKSNRATKPHGAAIWLADGKNWIPAAFVSNDGAKERSWSDTNGDGVVQEEERYAAPSESGFAWLDRDLRLFGTTGSIAPNRFDERGVPYYDTYKHVPYLAADADTVGMGWSFNSMPDAQGAVYFAENHGTHRHLGFWDRACENQVIKVANGKVAWVVGHHEPEPRNPSDLTTMTGIAGVVDGVVLAHTVHGYVAFTDDGLTLGNPLVANVGAKSQYGATALYIENFTGLFLKDPTTNKKVLFSVRSGDDPILEITGPDRLERMEGSITLDSSRPRQLLEVGHASIPVETWWGNNGRGYGIDGHDWEWTLQTSGLPLRQGMALIGDVRLRRDAGSLFVLANVQGEAFAYAPAGADANAVWNQAAGIEIVLAPEGAASSDALRIFLSANVKNGVAFQRRSGDTAWSPFAKAAVAVRPRWHGLGWRLEAELPLAALPASLRREVEQSFRRCKDGTSDIETKRAVLNDLVGPLRFNVSAHRMRSGTIERVPWVADDETLNAADRFNPKLWGVVTALQP